MHYVAMMFVAAALSVGFGGHSAEFGKAARAASSGEFGRAWQHVATAVDKTLDAAESNRDRPQPIVLQPAAMQPGAYRVAAQTR